MTRTFTYPVTLHPEPDDGGFTVTFPDLPEGVTCGDDEAHALAMAADCLAEVLAGRIADRQDIPHPSPADGRPTVSPGATIAAKAALYEAMREDGLSKVALAARLEIDEALVRRMLDPRHATKIGSLEDALAVLGRRLVPTFEAA